MTDIHAFTHDGHALLAVPAVEGTYTSADFEVLVTRRDPVAVAFSASLTAVPSQPEPVRQDGYVPVRLRNRDVAKPTPTVHAAPIYADGKPGKGLCDRRQESRIPKVLRGKGLGVVECSHCRAHLINKGYTLGGEEP